MGREDPIEFNIIIVINLIIKGLVIIIFCWEDS